MNTQTVNDDWGKRFVLCALLVVAGMAAYGNSFTGTFILDDQSPIVDNEDIRSLWLVGPRLVKTSRPVVMLSLAGNYFFGQLNVFGYHLVNLAIHLMAGLVLFGLVRRTLQLLPRYSEESWPADRLAFVMALVWLVHPLQTQSVTYVIQRSESLMGLFYLVCLYCLLRGSQASRSWPWYLAAVAACWLGMGTKQVMVTAPLVVLLYDRIFLADSWKEILRRRWAVYLGFVPGLVWLVFVTFRAASRPDRAMARFGVEAVTSLEYLGSQGGVILHYLRLAFWPDRLCLDYRWPVAESARAIVLPGAVVAVLLVASFVAIRSQPRLGFLGLSFFLILAPTSSIMPIADVAFEHRMYLPLAPLVVLVVLACDALARRFVPVGRATRYLAVAALTIVVVSLALRTIDRNRDYQNQVIMWTDVVQTAPHNPRAHFNLGLAFVRQDRLGEAVTQFQQTLTRWPDYFKVLDNLGVLLMRQGDLVGAAGHLRHALRVVPDNANTHHNFALVLARQRDFEPAVAHYKHSLRLKPDNAQALTDFGATLQMQGNLSAAAAKFEEAIHVDPDLAQARLRLGIVLSQQGKSAAAAVQLEEAIRIQPDFAKAHHYLGVAHLQQENLSEAAGNFQDALRFKPDYVEAFVGLGSVMERQGNLDGAVTYLQQALQINPNFVEAHITVGTIFGIKGNFVDAAAQFEEAIRIQPDSAPAHFNLGMAREQQGNLAQAALHYQDTLQLNPDHVGALVNLGITRVQQHQAAEAADLFRRALKLQPTLSGAANDLAWILATNPDSSLRDGQEAVRWAEQSAELIERPRPDMLDTLAAAYAEAGRWDEAVATARKAIELANAAGQETLSGQIEIRLRLYLQQKPFRDQPAP